MDIAAIFIFKSDSGSTLYSRKTKDVQEDMFSAFLSALKSFFSDFALGGLSSFASEDYIVYLASTHNVLTSILIEKKLASEKYFSLAFQIADGFYQDYNDIVDSSNPIIPSDRIQFDRTLDEIIEIFDYKTELQKKIIRLFEIKSNGESKPFVFSNSDQLITLPVFVAVNLITKQIYIMENDENVSNRILFFANKFATNLNQREFRSEFEIRNISEPWDIERLIDQFNNLLSGENIKL